MRASLLCFALLAFYASIEYKNIIDETNYCYFVHVHVHTYITYLVTFFYFFIILFYFIFY